MIAIWYNLGLWYAKATGSEGITQQSEAMSAKVALLILQHKCKTFDAHRPDYEDNIFEESNKELTEMLNSLGCEESFTP